MQINTKTEVFTSSHIRPVPPASHQQLYETNPIEFKSTVESLKNSQEGFSESSRGSGKTTLPSVGQFFIKGTQGGTTSPGQEGRAAHSGPAGSLTLPFNASILLPLSNQQRSQVSKSPQGVIPSAYCPRYRESLTIFLQSEQKLNKPATFSYPKVTVN